MPPLERMRQEIVWRWPCVGDDVGIFGDGGAQIVEVDESCDEAEDEEARFSILEKPCAGDGEVQATEKG